ncbi:MAG: hypothetical protein ACYDAQ_09045 [Mycobacteriales bacterium]
MAQHISHEVKFAVLGYLGRSDVLAFEACLLHLRNLIEFFVGRRSGRRPSDIWPSDYVTGWAVDEGTADRVAVHLMDVDRYLSHLSLARADDVPPADRNDLPFALPDLFRELIRLADRYVAEAGDASPGIVFVASEVTEARRLLGNGT